MSELYPGLPPPPPPPDPLPAAAVILWRDGDRGREVFWVRRGAPLRFAGGFHAFPGGKVDRGDSRVPVAGASGETAAAVAAAARELFEEAGVLVAGWARGLSRAERVDSRRRILAGELDFGAFVSRHGLEIAAADFLPAGRWVTPALYPLRFDARFFLVRVPEGEEATVWPGELAGGEWVATADALRAWEKGEVLLHPPTLWPLQCLERAGPPACLDAMRAPPHVEGFSPRRIEFQKGLFLVPLRTPTLPPAVHTACYLLDVGGGVAVVDPGSPWPAEQAALERVLSDLAAEGKPPRQIWVTHAHADHVGGVEALRARFGLSLRAHPDAAARLPAGAGSAEPIGDGELLAGRYRALHTPGHARGHLAFHDEQSGAVLAGDLVSTLSTIVVDPPEGHMATYLASLARIRQLSPRTIYPAHGPPAPDGTAKVDEYLAHRRAREDRVLAAASGGGTLEEVTARAYDDTPRFLHGVAARSCLASLHKLRDEGRVREDGGRWARA